MTCFTSSRGGIFTWPEVVAFTDAYFDPKRGPMPSCGTPFRPEIASPSVTGFAIDAIRECRTQLKWLMEQGGSGSDQVNAERRLKEAGEARSVLELFQKNLKRLCAVLRVCLPRSPFDDYDMERLCCLCSSPAASAAGRGTG